MKVDIASAARLSPRFRLPVNAWRRMMQTLLPSAVRMLGAGFQFLSTVIVARTYGDADSAGFFFWSAVLMTSGPIATFGLEQIALRNVPRIHREGPEAVGRFVARLRMVSLLASFLLGLGWVGYAVHSETAPGGFQPWHLLPPVALIGIALTLINGEALKGLGRPVLGTVYGHLLPVTLFCLSMALFARHLHPTSVLSFYAGSYLVGALVARFAPVPDFRERFVIIPSRGEFRQLTREGLPIACVSLFGALGFIVPLAMLELTRPAAEVSHLTTAFRVSILFLVLASAIHSVFAPDLSRSAELSKPLAPVFKVYGKAIALALAALALPIMVGIAFPELVMAVFGEEFRGGAPALRLLLVIQLISLCLGPVPHLLLMTGHTNFLARLSGGRFIAATLLSLLLVPRFGGPGMIIAMGAAALAVELIGLAYVITKLRRLQHQP